MLSLYVDSATRTEAEPLLRLGVFRGVTTNPKLLHKAGVGPDGLAEVYAWATGAGAQEVFVQTWGHAVEELCANAERLLGLGEQVVVKVPASAAGIQAAGRLVRQGATVLLTAVYTPHQAVTAGALGVHYVAPYLGKMAEEGGTAREDVAAMRELLAATGCRTRVLAASLRSTADLSFLARHGVDAFALPVPVARKLFEDTHTATAVRQFDKITDTW